VRNPGEHPVGGAKRKPSPGGGAGRIVLPPHGRGWRIGLFGGSFNPPHAAHRAVSLLAMKRLRLDAVWWVVSPGNPLKDHRALQPLADRMAAARAVARHPRIVVTDLEARIGTRFTLDTLRYLKRHAPGIRFVWISGADVLSEFHRWRGWQNIFRLVPIAIVDRDGRGLTALASPAAQAMREFRLPERNAARLAARRTPAWVFLHGLRSSLSSTVLRHKTGTRTVAS
jgi:nicotinate-nucleotide adenylyltransferase